MLKQAYFSWNLLDLSEKNTLDQTWKASNIKYVPQWEDVKNSYQLRHFLVLFCRLIALTLAEKCIKSLRVSKTVKEIKFKGVWRKLEAKCCFQYNHGQNIWEKL